MTPADGLDGCPFGTPALERLQYVWHWCNDIVYDHMRLLQLLSKMAEPVLESDLNWASYLAQYEMGIAVLLDQCYERQGPAGHAKYATRIVRSTVL